jgi:hypothetical protein
MDWTEGTMAARRHYEYDNNSPTRNIPSLPTPLRQSQADGSTKEQVQLQVFPRA